MPLPMRSPRRGVVNCPGWRGRLALGASARSPVQRQVEAEDVDPGLAQKPQRAPFDVLVDEAADLVLGEIARLGDAGDLEIGGLRGDVRVEAAARGGDEVDRHGRRSVLALELVDLALDAL